MILEEEGEGEHHPSPPNVYYVQLRSMRTWGKADGRRVYRKGGGGSKTKAEGRAEKHGRLINLQCNSQLRKIISGKRRASLL